MKTSEILGEKWSAKYKRSIDCNNPKGFSQRAHCDGRKKNEAAYPAQQISRYNPDSETYRGAANRIPNSNTVDKKDITVKGKRSEFPDDSYNPDLLANINKEQLEKLINDALGTLSKREELVLRARFGIKPFTQDFNLQQVGDAMGVSKTRARQIEARALRKLKMPSVSRKLRGMMDEEVGSMPDWETIVALAVAAKMTPMAIKAMWRTAKGAYKIKKFADKAGIKLADKLVGENEQQELPIDLDRIRDLIQRLESNQTITPQEADDMRRAAQALASGRDTILPDRLLQLLTMVA